MSIAESSNRTNVGLKHAIGTIRKNSRIRLKSDQCGIETAEPRSASSHEALLKSDQCGIETGPVGF